MVRPVPSRVLAAVAAELEAGRGELDGLATLAGELVRACPPERRAAAIGEAQAADLLDQRLQALAGFLRRLAEGHAPDAAAAEVPLAALAQRLRSAAGSAAAGDAAGASGELELFD